eukprot:1548115-Alexandrium_andersonii.AAC.1
MPQHLPHLRTHARVALQGPAHTCMRRRPFHTTGKQRVTFPQASSINVAPRRSNSARALH